MKSSNSAGGIAALVFICLILILTLFNYLYDAALGQNAISLTVDLVIFLCAFMGCGLGIKHILLRKQYKTRSGFQSQCLDEVRYKVAIEKLNCTIFNYSTPKNTIHFTDNLLLYAGLSALNDTEPESLIENGIIHPDTAEEYRRVFREIREGKSSAICTVQILNAEGKFRWCKIILENIYENNQKVNHAFGIIEDITEQKETEKRFVKEHQYREALLSSASLIYKVNLTKNRFSKGQDSWTELFGMTPSDSYSKNIAALSRKAIYPEDAEQFLSTYTLESVMAAYKQGQKEVSLEYRRQLLDGTVMWVRCMLYLVRDPFSQDIKGIAYIKDINNQKNREIEMQYRAERDYLSGLYNRGTIRQLVTEYLSSEEGKQNQHALLILDIDNFKSINDNQGHLQGDSVLKTVSGSLQGIFRSTDILGRIGGDEFILFLKNISKPEAAIRKAKEINCALKSLSIGDCSHRPLSASIGIALCPENGATFDELYRSADIALYQAKKNGKDSYVLYQQNELIPQR